MKFKLILCIGLCLCLLSGCSDETPNQTDADTQEQSEQANDVVHEAWYTEPEQFKLWSDATQHLQTTEEPVLEGFSLAEYFKCDTRYLVIYDDEYIITFYKYHLEIQEKNTGNRFEQALPWYLTNGKIAYGTVSIKRSDVDADGIEDLVFETWFTGTVHEQYIDVLDLGNYTWSTLDYEPEELVENASDFNADAYDYNYDETDFRWFEDGVIYVETLFGHNMNPLGSGETVGAIVGRLIYQPETNSFVLDKESVTIEWYEQ